MSSGLPSWLWHRSDGLQRLTLKFPDASTEREFLRHSTAGLWGKLSCYGLIILGSSLVYGLINFLCSRDAAGRMAAVYPGVQADDGILAGGVLCYAVLLAGGGRLRCLTRRASPRVVEIVAVLVVLMSFTFAFALEIPIWGRIKGHEIAGCVHDEALLLRLFNITITSYVFLKIRWCIALPVQLYPVLCFALMKYGASIPECGDAVLAPSMPFKITSLLLTTMAASAGTHMAELEARGLFMQFIMEKTHRVESEFQLEQLQQTAPSATPPGPPSLCDSLPTTTSTNQVLELNGDSATGQQLAAVAELGRKEFWLIEMAELDWLPGRILGMGSFGIVISGMHLGLNVAIKVPKYPPEATPQESAVVELCNELKILRRLTHPNILAFHGACVDAQFRDMALVLELVNGVSLRDFVRTNSSNVDKARILQEVAGALCYLHGQEPRIVHGDLKDSNVHVQQGRDQASWGPAKLLDFGLARQITKRAKPLGGSVAWMAPEVASPGDHRPGMATDVFSLGRVAFFVVTGVSPGQGRSRGALLRQLRRGVAPVLNWPAMDAFSCKYKDCIEGCCSSDPSQRPSMLQAREMLAEKRRLYVGQDYLLRQREDLHSRLQVVRRAAAKWQRSAADRSWRSNDSSEPHSLGALEALVEEAAPPAGEAAPSAASAAEGGPPMSRRHPHLRLTPMQTQAQVVAPALLRFNFSIPPGSCCMFHAAVLNLKRVADWLAEKPCMSLAESMAEQCPRCGALVQAEDSASEANNLCDVCGEGLAVPGPNTRGVT